MTEAQFRNKIIWFSFAFSLLVVWVHASNAELYLGLTMEMARISIIERWIGSVLGQVAVPGFFMISGYLFYRNFTWGKLKGKWLRRVRSVLVPFILWNTIYYLGYVIGSRLPWVNEVVGKGVIPLSLPAAVDAIINYTYNYVFWYLYQLILLILLAPVLYPVLRNRWSRAGLAVILCILIASDIRLPLVNADALFYYSAAASLALEAMEPDGVRTVEAAFDIRRGAAGVLCLLAAALFYADGLREGFVLEIVMCRFLAVGGLWLVVPGERLPKAAECMRYNFFLYAVHFAFVRFINKAGAMLLPVTDWLPLLLYLLMPLLVLAVSTVLGKILRRWCPNLWGLLNGYR